MGSYHSGPGKEKATQPRGNRREVREGIRYRGVAVLVELIRDTWGLAMPETLLLPG